MIIKRYSELKHKLGFDEKPWLIVGTGPSIENIFRIPFLDAKFNILAINHAGDYLLTNCIIPFVWFCADYLAIDETGSVAWLETDEFCLLSRAKNYSKIISEIYLRDLQQRIFRKEFPAVDIRLDNLYFIEYDKDYDKGSEIEPLFPTEEFSPSGCSSATAVRILGELGIKEIFTCGIDGGISVRAPQFDGLESTEEAIREKVDYDLHNAGMDHWARVYGISIKKMIY